MSLVLDNNGTMHVLNWFFCSTLITLCTCLELLRLTRAGHEPDSFPIHVEATGSSCHATIITVMDPSSVVVEHVVVAAGMLLSLRSSWKNSALFTRQCASEVKLELWFFLYIGNGCDVQLSCDSVASLACTVFLTLSARVLSN